MWPWGHLAVGYVLYAGLTRLRWRRSPGGIAALVVAFGTQFPDLIDKPLAWTFHLLASGRSLAHSAFTTTLVVALVAWYARRRDRTELAVAFAVGYYSHLFADAIGPFLAGQYRFLTFLAWPLLAPPPYGHEGGIIEHFRNFELTGAAAFQIVLALAIFGLWVRDGKPGLAVVRSWLSVGSNRDPDTDR